MQVQVNMTAEQLNEFIGGDSEVALKLKHSIIQQFTSKYLKGIANGELDKAKEDVCRYMTQEFIRKNGWSQCVGIKGELEVKVKDYIRNQVGYMIDEHLHHIINEIVKEKDFKDELAKVMLGIFKRNYSGSLISKFEKLLQEESNNAPMSLVREVR